MKGTTMFSSKEKIFYRFIYIDFNELNGKLNLLIALSEPVSLSVSEFVGSAVSILEGIAQHPTLLMEHQGKIIETILPELVALTGSQNGELMTTACSTLFFCVSSCFCAL